MPFDLCNAPATFERVIETVLGGLSYEACLVYLDDIIIVGRSFEEHLKNIRRLGGYRDYRSMTWKSTTEKDQHMEMQTSFREDPVLGTADTARESKKNWRNISNSPPSYNAIDIGIGLLE
ncbi:retrovirus-related Pol polyprotein from transposon 412 [Trichonephila clavipes]|nr:retrovirus-related Pol polyprotein from transposon 412 [Trichonephila clavipes]